MKYPKSLILTLLSLSSTQTLGVSPETLLGHDTENTPIEKDNTALNREIKTTAQTQARSADADTELTRKLRERLMADNQLSTSAHNVKIITVKEAIILEGPVANRSERVKIENYARMMAGKKKVYNRLKY